MMSSSSASTHNAFAPPIPGKSPARPATRPLPSPALTPSPRTRKPSLASPSPPTPLIPSFNATCRPAPPPPQNQANPAQYITFQRSCPTLPDSPNSLAMMKRLLAKPAAPAGYAYSGSESEGKGVTRSATMSGWKSEDGERQIPVKSEERRRDGAARSATMNGWRSDDGPTSTVGQRRGEQDTGERRIPGKPEEKRRDEANPCTVERGKPVRDLASPSTSERKPEEKPRKLIRRKPSTLPVASPSTTVKRSMSAAATSPRSLHFQTPSPSHKPPSLTPASALVEAYRAQEQRERVHDVTSPPSSSLSKTPQERTEDEPPATPYYTVFGSSSDRVVPVDSREAHTAGWTAQGYLDGVQRSTTVKSTGSSTGGLKTLTRKVSARWKKPQPGDEERGRARPRPSLQAAARKDEPAGTRARSLSIDDFAPSSGLKTLTRKVSGRRLAGDDQARRGRHTRRPSDVEVEEGGSKLWRLVKRISAGGLRDKYRAESPPPPVPTLKQHPAAVSRLLPSTPSSRSSSASTRSRVTTPAKPQAHTASSSPVSSSSSKFWKGAQSPQSSTSSFGEVPPVPVLNKLRKKKSGVGNHIVPPSELCRDLPGTPSPSSQPPHHLNLRPRTADSEEWMIVGSPCVELPSLPFPPRRQPPKDDSETDRGGRESPLLPEFSISGVINTFPSRRDKPSQKPAPLALSPMMPARPTSSPTSPSYHARKSESNVDGETNRRSEGGLSMLTIRPGRRTSSIGESSPSALMAVFGPPADASNPSSTPCTGSSHRVTKSSAANSPAAKPPAVKSSAANSPSAKSAATKSPAASSTSPSSHGLSRQHTLSEQEKTRRWDDLLERSARAGGTLHLAGDLMLQSDKLRFSTTPSELSNLTLLG